MVDLKFLCQVAKIMQITKSDFRENWFDSTLNPLRLFSFICVFVSFKGMINLI